MNDLEDLGNKILKLDKKIRFVYIVLKDKSYMRTREEFTNLLTTEQTDELVDDALARWETRRKLAHKLGEPLYAIAEYKNVKRITVPIDTDGLILITVDPTGLHEKIIKEIIELKEMLTLNLD